MMDYGIPEHVVQTATKSTLKHLRRGSIAKSPNREDYQAVQPAKFRTTNNFHKRKNTVQPVTMNLTQNNFNQIG